MTPSASADLELMRASTLLEPDPAAAARIASDVLGRFPGHEEANLLLATACRRLGDASTSVAVLESLASAHPESSAMRLEAGRAYAAAGRHGEARAAFERAVALDAGLADAWRELAAERFRDGDVAGGDAAYVEYSRRSLEPPELADACVALAENRLETAEALLRARLRTTPGDVVARRYLAEVATRRGDVATAEAALRECLALAPGYGAARYDLARVLYAQQRADEVLALVDRLLAAEPESSGFLGLRAQALRFLGRNDEAIAVMEHVVARYPDDAHAWRLFGQLLREMGQQERAIDAYRRALAVQPDSGEAYWSLANLKTYRLTAEDIVALRALLERSPLVGTNRIQLEFALGKALEDAGEYAESFEHYARGNAIHRNAIDYTPDATTADVRRSEALYTPRFFAERACWGSPRRDPIFIVGLPRSGSTLLEQILASHSEVEGTRELLDVTGLARELLAGGTNAYPEPVASLTRGEAEALAERYLAQTAVHRPLGRPRFVDKMLSNFGHVGFIHLMFPNAAIIDARRHPLACGFSCYKQLFARGVGFSYDLEDIGRYYRDYHELMEHMDAVLPGRVHRVYYEALVADPEREVRRLLEYCGLAFEESCLRFYDTPRPVLTLSSEQVRRPIYGDAVGHWRNYEPWLGPLAASIGDLVARYPATVAPAR